MIRAAGDTLTATGSLAGFTYRGGSSKKKHGRQLRLGAQLFNFERLRAAGAADEPSRL